MYIFVIVFEDGTLLCSVLEPAALLKKCECGRNEGLENLTPVLWMVAGKWTNYCRNNLLRIVGMFLI